jgi:hypothetical protein
MKELKVQNSENERKLGANESTINSLRKDLAQQKAKYSSLVNSTKDKSEDLKTITNCVKETLSTHADAKSIEIYKEKLKHAQ